MHPCSKRCYPAQITYVVRFTVAGIRDKLVADCRSHSGPWPLRVLRSSQLDAQRLDAELQTMLHEQFMAVFQLLPQVGPIKDHISCRSTC
jgi:hypothetical protein